LKISEISEVEFGDRVKIFGTINSTDQVAIRGTYEGDSSRWLWLPTNFHVEDESGTIWVDNIQFWTVSTNRIKAGSHEHRQYWDEDKICIIGTIHNNSVMGKSVAPDYIGNSPDDFAGFPLSVVFLSGIVTVGLVMLSFLMGTTLLERKRLHMKNFDDFSPKHVLKKKPKPKTQFLKTHKTKWTEFNYSTTLKTDMAVLFIFFGVIVFLIILLMSALGRSADEVDWGEICFCSSSITIVITLLFTAILAYGLKENIGEYTLRYEGDRHKFGYNEIEEKIMGVILDFGLPFTKDKKVPYAGSWKVTLKIPRECGDIKFTYTEVMDKFNLVIIIGKGVKEDNEYKEQIRGALELALDEHFGLEPKAEPVK
jgi:hypothetical protein